jgi:SDR family mycofactocin-dependent oxidoreductase
MARGLSRVALVTGAARGIGAASARSLATDGWKVVAVDRASPDPRLPYEMGTAGQLDALAADGIDVRHGDVTDGAALATVVAEISAREGGLDAVVAAAGVIAGGVPLWKMPADELEAVLAVDLHGVIATARAAIPALLQRPAPRAGRFIAIASTAATRGMPMLSAYCAAKAGVTGLVRGLAAELRGTGVTANAVSPGSTRTAILDESARLYGLASADAFAAQQAVERLLEPSEVAALVVWLAGAGGGAVTGANLPVDGGLGL